MTAERYVPLVDLKDEIPFAADAYQLNSGEWDALLTRLLDEESSRVESSEYADTRFTTTQTSRTWRGNANLANGRMDLILPERPIQSVESVIQDGDELTEDGDYVVLDETHLRVLPDAEITRWTDKIDMPLTVEWTYGFEEPPGDIRDAVIRLVRSRLERIKSDGLGSESMPTGQSADYRPPEEIHADVKNIVGKHKPPSYSGGGYCI